MIDLPGIRALAERSPQLKRNLMRFMAWQRHSALECLAGDRLHTAALPLEFVVRLSKCRPIGPPLTSGAFWGAIIIRTQNAIRFRS
jgi:hypothetical protein